MNKLHKLLVLSVVYHCFVGNLILFSNDQTTCSSELTEQKELFWEREAKMVLWEAPYERVWQQPQSDADFFVGRWFVNGKLNVAENCVDRWASRYPNATALIWVGEDDRDENRIERIFSYQEMQRRIDSLARQYLSCKVKKGDRITIYLSMVPELVFAQLAAAKIGAITNVVFSGFSPKNLQERIIDSTSKIVVTQDEAFRKGKKIEMKESLDPILSNCPTVEKVLVVQRTHATVPMTEGRDLFVDANDQALLPALPMDSADPLFILYTSGTTGKPKGIVHSTGGYLVYVMSTMKNVWGIKGLLGDFPDISQREVWFSTADIGWITGHSYTTYAPFALGVVTLIYEGVPTYPSEERIWELIDRFHVTHFYTAPTLIRSLMMNKEKKIENYSLDSLRVLGSVGEPLNPTAWEWYFTHVGKGKCPIVDTYWQTETGGYLISPIAGATVLKPGSCCFPCFGVEPLIVDRELFIKNSWPGMALTIYGDHERFLSTYLKKIPGYYFTGDEATIDDDGYFWILGRLDDVIKVSGHRLSSSELEKSLCSFPAVAEAAVVGKAHPIKGHSLFAFVVLKTGASVVVEDLQKHIRKELGAIAVPDDFLFVDELPKTRSGKIVRRMLSQMIDGKVIEDVSVLADAAVLEKIKIALTKEAIAKL